MGRRSAGQVRGGAGARWGVEEAGVEAATHTVEISECQMPVGDMVRGRGQLAWDCELPTGLVVGRFKW